MKAEIIYYSATGSTKKIIKAFSQNLVCDIHFTDITLPNARKNYHLPKCDMLVIATPIYGEQIPRFINAFIQKLKGQGQPLIAISVYGNIGYGISLSQFEEYAQKNNFQLIAAGAFIGQHTYASKKATIAYGRPDQNDLKQVQSFSKQVWNKMMADNFEPPIIPKSTLPKFITKFPDAGTRFLIQQPAIIDNAICNHCGLCAKKCPVGSIDPKTLKINEQNCIRCYACVKCCPQAARTVKFRFPVFENLFGYIGRKRRKNQTFL